jgi:anhydro-N-acetylmuramic acid kinase
VATSPASVEDRLHTFSRWLAQRIVRDLRLLLSGADAGAIEVLTTGGGAHNDFLMEQLRLSGREANLVFEPAEATVTDFKEAALIALCALLRQRGLPNSLASATGAHRDTVNGALYAPQPF